MATIQIRDVPEEVHRTYQIRARRAGQSLQEYIRQELIDNAARVTPAELAEGIRRRLEAEGSEGFSTVSSVEFVRSDRESH